MKKDLTLCLDTGSSAQGIALVDDKNLKVEYSTTLITGSAYTDGQKKETRAGKRRRDKGVKKRYAKQKKQAQKLLKLFGILDWIDDKDFINWLNLNPYFLRVKGLTEALTKAEFARIMFNFLHHRGFNAIEFKEDIEEDDKKVKSKDDDDKKKVTSKLKELNNIIGEGCKYRTVGEYLHETFTKAHIENQTNPDKILCEHIYSKEDIIKEFDLLYETQSKLNSYLGKVPGNIWNTILKEVVGIEKRKSVKKHGLKFLIKDYIIFYNKPPKSYKPMIGQCCCIPNKKRSPMFSSEYQDYRIWDQINNLRITDDTRDNQPLNQVERDTLKNHLDNNVSILVSELADLFSNMNAKFNFNGTKKIIGNRTNAILKDIIPGFINLTNEEKDSYLTIIYEHNKTNKIESLLKIAQEKWKLSRYHALKLINIPLETNRKEFSKDALKQINSYMKHGELCLYDIKEHLGFNQQQPINLKKISNPDVKQVVKKIKREFRKIFEEYGNRIRLARIESSKDFITKKQADKILKSMNKNEKFNEEVISEFKVIKGFKPYNPKHLLKAKLHIECNGICPYTNKKIDKKDLFSNTSTWTIEHIVPKCQSGGNEFINLTLCDLKFNKLKDGRTPVQMKLDGDISEIEYENILSRVRIFQFKKELADVDNQPKFKKFVDDVEQDGFINGQLTDTRYITKIMMQLMKEVFGIQAQGVKSNIVSNLAERIGAYDCLKDQLSIFKPEGKNKGEEFYHHDGKNRLDHRHHAVDAILTGFLSQENIKKFNNRLIRFDFTDIKNSIKESVERILVNHPKNNKVRGMLHEATCYGFTGKVEKNKKVYTYEGVEMLKDPLIEIKYADGNVKCFKSGNNHHLPLFQNKEGVLLTRTKLNKNLKPQVSMFEAYQRKRSGEDIHKMEIIGVENVVFYDAFHINDMIIYDPEGKKNLNEILESGDKKLISKYLYRVESIDGSSIKIRHHLLSYKDANLVMDNMPVLKAEAYTLFLEERQKALIELKIAEENADDKKIKEAKKAVRKKFVFLLPKANIGGYKKAIDTKSFKAIKIEYDILGNIKLLKKFNV